MHLQKIQSRYRPDIDGLRAIAVLLVVGFHAFPTAFPGGFIGVDVFFVISGFLISGILFDEIENGRFSLLWFYVRRIRRIFPALILVTIAVLWFGWISLFPSEYKTLGLHATEGAAYVLNFFLWAESGYFDRAAETKPLQHLWSLAVEEQFYILWPLLLVGLRRLHVGWFASIAVVTVGSFLANVIVTRHSPETAFYFSPTRTWELSTGALLALAVRNRGGASPRDRRLLAPAGIVLLVAGVILIAPDTAFPGFWALLPVTAAILVIAAGSNAWVNLRLLSYPPLVWIGLISYPLYLWRWPLLTYLRIILGEEPRIMPRLIAVALSLLLAWLTFEFVEKRIRFNFTSRKAVLLLAVNSAVFLFGIYVGATGGVPGRGISEQLASADVFRGSRKSDASCKRLLDISLPADAVCITNSPEPKILFVGNSHAMALNSAIYTGDFDAKSLLIGAHGCSVYPKLHYTPTFEHSFGNNCTAIAEAAIGAAMQLPSLETIIIAMNAAKVRADVHSIFDIDGVPLSEREAFSQGNGAMIHAMQKAGKRVVFSIDTPRLTRAPESCLRRLWFMEPAGCVMTRELHDSARAAYLEAVRGLSRDHPGLTVFDPTGLFCDETTCRDQRDGHSLYNDRHHISVFGSQMVLQEMARAGAIAASP